MKKFIILICCVFFLCSCYSDHGHYTIITNKMLDTSHFQIPKQTAGKRVKGRAVFHTVLGFNFGQCNLSRAMDRGMARGYNYADTLVDADITEWSWFIPLIYGQSGWKVEGRATSSKEQDEYSW